MGEGWRGGEVGGGCEVQGGEEECEWWRVH